MSPKEFKNLPRYDNGRLKDLPNIFYRLTSKQVNDLHSDDWSYYEELQEELSYLRSEAMREFA